MDIYLAGRIYENGWRHKVVENLRGAFSGGEDFAVQNPVLENSIFGVHDYVGPYFISCDHSCAHGVNTHGVGLGGDNCASMQFAPTADDNQRRKTVFNKSLRGIDRADLVFAWIGEPEVYGTLVEVGYAKSQGKILCVASPREKLKDLWFSYEAADMVMLECFKPERALARLLSPHESIQPYFANWWYQEKTYQEYLNSNIWKATREKALSFYGNKCQNPRCPNRIFSPQVHHKTYRNLGCEVIETDLMILCRDCHEEHHRKEDKWK